MSAAADSLGRLRSAVDVRRREGVPATGLANRLEALHAEGIQSFDAHGLPTRRDERWKGTNLAALEADGKKLALELDGKRVSTRFQREGEEIVLERGPKKRIAVRSLKPETLS